jgi:hypothetical protein
MTRDHRKQPLARNFLAVIALMFAGCFAAASDDASSASAYSNAGSPTNFDYLVLASIADSPHLFSMAGYRSTARPPPAPPGASPP